MKDDRILLAHGSGGAVSHSLISDFFLKVFTDPTLKRLDDSAVLELGSDRVAFTTDSYVVKPLFFPGGDIGRLAVCGTVNDLAMSGAEPKFISVGFVIEEGLEVSELEKILKSMAEACEEAGVPVVTGDTKVVDRGSADQIFINTAGVGYIKDDIDISGSNVKDGDAILLSGSIGDHGIAVMSKREGLAFGTPVISDCAPLNGMVKAVLDSGAEVHALRDPTRGGLASTLNEFAEQSGVAITIDESKVPISEGVLGACEMLGLDPYQVANEGKLVAAVAGKDADRALEAIRANKYGKDAQIIGTAKQTDRPKVFVSTAIGTTRILDMLSGEQLPRIC